MRQHRVLVRPALEVRPSRLAQFLHGRSSSARGRLIRRDDQPLDAIAAVDRPQRRDRDDRRAVGIGDDSLMLFDRLRIDLRDDQRDLRVHAEGRRVVHHDRTGTRRNRSEALGLTAARREQRDMNAAEAVLRQFLHWHGFTAKRKRLARGTRRGEQPKLRERKLPSLQTLDQLNTHRAGGAHDGHNGRRR